MTTAEAIVQERIAAKLQAEGACSVFAGARNHHGYGVVRLDGRYWLAHRLVWTLLRGPIPEGMVICHRCDNPPCCAIEHLFMGTQLDNNRDRHAKGRTVVPNSGWGGLQRAKTHCPQGHAYDAENTRYRKNGARRCAACSRQRGQSK